MRICSKCNQDLPKSAFHKRIRVKRDGLNSICKACYSKQRKKAPYRPYEKRSNKYKIPDYKNEARSALRYAVKTGKIIKPSTCEKCKKNFPANKIHGHHYNGYGHKMDVQWLCYICHSDLHRICNVA